MNAGLLEIARDLSLPLVATNDCHYLRKEDARAHEVLLCIQTGKTLKDADRMRFSTDEFFFRSAEEMEELFSYCPEALRNTVEVAERCNLDLKLGELQFPRVPGTPGGNPGQLSGEIRPGRPGGTPGGNEARAGRVPSIRPRIYRQRLENEVGMIQKMGFSGYFLIVSDFIRYAKSKNIPVGPGRGSGAGSLAAYCLGITEIDPLANGLLFERFLNPERVSPPDIDIDFCIQGREEVIQYVQEQVRPGPCGPDHHLREDAGPGRDPGRGPGPGHALRRSGPDRQDDPQHLEHHPEGSPGAGAPAERAGQGEPGGEEDF